MHNHKVPLSPVCAAEGPTIMLPQHATQYSLNGVPEHSVASGKTNDQIKSGVFTSPNPFVSSRLPDYQGEYQNRMPFSLPATSIPAHHGDDQNIDPVKAA